MILFKAMKHDDVPPVAILNYQRVYHGISLAIKDVVFFMRKLGDLSRTTLEFT